jgi:arabinan endo-1,5-alpha-L-arabinosidase
MSFAGRWARLLTGLTAALGTLTLAAAPTLATTVRTLPTGALPTTTPTAHAVHLWSSYTNPVSAGFADTYADPSVIRGRDGWWYAYGTSDPLREGQTARHLIPISRSRDLVSWSYIGDAFTDNSLPAWADRSRDAALWAPDIRYVGGQYRLYYVVTETTVTDEPNDNAIGMATAPTPAGPWRDSGAPVIGPRHGAGGSGDWLWTFDPALAIDRGQQYLFFGSYYGGIQVAPLDDTGTRVTGPSTLVGIDNKFEGAYVVRHSGWWYLFASTANCCAGPVTGYSVQVGRSRSLTGPYVDRTGARLDVSRAGGTPVIAPNGNRWVGTGHNAVITDAAEPGSADWLVYHAIDRGDPYLSGTDGINQRPMLLDRLDWIQGWPTVRGGRWASEGVQPAPLSRAGQRPVRPAPAPRLGRLVPADSDEFNAAQLAPGWTTVRSPATTLGGGRLRWPTEPGDLSGSTSDASVLLRRPPAGNWSAVTKVSIDLGTDTVRNFQQAGLIAYVNDDLFTRLSHVAIWNTRQSEFGKEMPYAGRVVYGGTIVGPPAETTWLRLTHRIDPVNGEHELRASTSTDGRSWVHGGVWTLPAGADVRVGLISHGGAGATAQFDWFRLYRSARTGS